MIYLIFLTVLNWIALYFMLLLCFSGVFTAMFNSAAPQYVDFSTSLRSLFTATLNVWDIFGFTDHIFAGSAMLALWEILSQVIMLNILIALLANVYGEFTKVVDSEHSSVVLTYYTIWHWDDCFGSMLFLPSPFTYFTIWFTPWLLLSRDPRNTNYAFTKVFYFPYALVQFAIFLAASLFYLPFLYLKGFVIYGKTGSSKPKKSKKLFNGVES